MQMPRSLSKTFVSFLRACEIVYVNEYIHEEINAQVYKYVNI